jgi:hypothetical protein
MAPPKAPEKQTQLVRVKTTRDVVRIWNEELAKYVEKRPGRNTRSDFLLALLYRWRQNPPSTQADFS